MKIKKCYSRIIFNSSGHKTGEIELVLDDGKKIISSAPTGSTKGQFEITEGFEENIEKTIRSFNENCAIEITKIELNDINEFDCQINQLNEIFNFGGNLLTALSYAGLKACAYNANLTVEEYLSKYSVNLKEKTKTFPIFNIIDGNKSKGSKLKGIEILLIPTKNDENILDVVSKASEVFYETQKLLWENYYFCGTGCQGALVPEIETLDVALDYLKCALTKLFPLNPYGYFTIGLDMAMSDRFKDGIYECGFISLNKILTNVDLKRHYECLINKYSITYIEDGFSDSDYLPWSNLLDEFPKINVSGDDLTATNVNRLQYCIDKKLINTIVIKPDQIGTISDCIETIKLAKKNKIVTVASQRTCETDENIVVRLATSLQLDFMKVGAPNRGERISKCNYLIRRYSD